MNRKITSHDAAYRAGDLSVFPAVRDTHDTLYFCTNNAETRLKHALTPLSRSIIVEDGSRFPESGILRLALPGGRGEAELVHYRRRIGDQFHELLRGFSGSRRSGWPAQSQVILPVMADHHNAVKDAVLQLQKDVGLPDRPDPQSLAGLVRNLEKRWLAPRPNFRSYPRSGPGPLTVHFQPFGHGPGVRYLWDFGDGSTSTERSPNHTYAGEGKYAVRLTMVTATNAVGISEKPDYVEVGPAQAAGLCYAEPQAGRSVRNGQHTEFELVDQTPGEVLARTWHFGDGTSYQTDVPYEHTCRHAYAEPGEYTVLLTARRADGTLRSATKVTVL